MLIIDTLLGVAKTLFGLRGELKKAKVDRRGRIATYFESISKCLADVSTSLKDGQVPHGKCAEMKTYAEALPAAISHEIGYSEARRLSEELGAAYQVEALLSELSDSNQERELAKLDEAAGIFQALANTIRASV